MRGINRIAAMLAYVIISLKNLDPDLFPRLPWWQRRSKQSFSDSVSFPARLVGPNIGVYSDLDRSYDVQHNFRSNPQRQELSD
jgi:hypothetical protein